MKLLCPMFNLVIERLEKYFGMKVAATRFNWYKNNSEWKPFHHDSAGLKPGIARVQNITVGVSFGATRDAAFEWWPQDSDGGSSSKSAKHDCTSAGGSSGGHRCVVSMPQPDGCCYVFGRDANIIWKHGILPAEEMKDEGRISIIAWGWIEQVEI
jgi:hypothetical protein